MKVKRFVGSSEAEALAAARLELGPNAVILETRRIRKGILGLLGKGATELLAAVEEQPGPPPTFRQQLCSALDAVPGGKTHIAAATATLLQHGVDPALAFEISESLKGATVEEALDEAVAGLLSRSVTRPMYQRGTVVALVGPTGSGKTTTAAKICAIAALKCGLDTVWVAADTFRVGGVEQASTYAEIMGIPLFVCATVREVRLAVQSQRKADFVVVDTTGRSHLNSEQVSLIGQVVEAARATEVHLTLPAFTAWFQAQEIIKGFAPTGFNRLTITKIDEATRAGTILNLAGLCQTPIVYFTTGQSVPDDICPAGPALVKNIIMRGRHV